MHGGAAEDQAPADPALGSWDTDLHTFHPHAVFSPLANGQFTKVRSLANAIHGKVLLMLLHRQALPDPDAVAPVDPADVSEEGEVVVVKKMETWRVRQGQAGENNDRRAHRLAVGNTEDALNEIGVLMFLSQSAVQCPFILRIVGCWEDDTHTWLTTENCDGGELFQLAAGGEQLSEAVVRRFTLQLLQAVSHLHQHNIGHRDISLENLLLKGDSLRLMDFGQAVLLNTAEGVPYRYYSQAGKAYYRAPEAYIPRREMPAEVPQEGWAPGAVVQVRAGGYFCEVYFEGDVVPGGVGRAEPYGYMVAPCDAFACGVCMFILQTQLPPWRTATLADPLFAYINENNVQSIFQAWRKQELSPAGMDVMSGLMQGLIVNRWGVVNALASPWFAGD